jgi:hypothetical protein
MLALTRRTLGCAAPGITNSQALTFCAEVSLQMLALTRCTLGCVAFGLTNSKPLAFCARVSLQMLALTPCTLGSRVLRSSIGTDARSDLLYPWL